MEEKLIIPEGYYKAIIPAIVEAAIADGCSCAAVIDWRAVCEVALRECCKPPLEPYIPG